MHFFEDFDQNLRFFGAHSPSKLISIGNNGAFKKFPLKIVPKGDHLCWLGIEFLQSSGASKGTSKLS